MTDLRSVFIDLEHGADYALDVLGLEVDDGLDTAIILSLFTDARANDDDALPLGQSDRRGWWGDAYPAVDGDRIGSRRWLLRASKQLQESLTIVKQYDEEALAWMVTDGVAQRVEVETFIVRDEVMGEIIRIYRPDGSVSSFRFEQLWNQV
jgi:phage gp46-like protein